MSDSASALSQMLLVGGWHQRGQDRGGIWSSCGCAFVFFPPFIQRQLVLSVGWPCSWYKLWWGTRGGGVESWVAGIVL